MKNKYLVFLIVLIIFLTMTFLITGCADSGTKELPPIKIAINQWPGYATAFIAQEKGLFEKNGVRVELIFDIEYIKSKERYTTGETDGIFEVFSDTIFQNSEGLRTKAVYITDYSDSGDIIIGKPEFNSLADLKGKKISVDGINSFSHLFVLSILENAGVKESEVQFENIPAQDVLTSLESGEIDAGHTWEPTKSAALAEGYKQLGKAGEVPGIITDVLVFKENVVKERPEEIRAIIKSLVEAEEFVDNNPEEAIKIMSEKEEMTPEDMALGLKGVHQPSVEESLKAMSPGGYLYTSGDFISDFYFNRGQMSRKLDLSRIIEPKFLDEIKSNR